MSYLRNDLYTLMEEAASETGRQNQMVTFEATVIPGFEHQAVEEIKDKLKAPHVFRVRGHVFFNASVVDYETKLLKLRSVDNYYMVLHNFGPVKFSSNDKAADLALIKSFAVKVDWKSKLPIWASLVNYNGTLFPEKPSSPPVVPPASDDSCPPGAVVPEAAIPSETTDVSEISAPVDAAPTTPISEVTTSTMAKSGVEELNASLPGALVLTDDAGSVDKSDDGGGGGVADKKMTIVIDNASSDDFLSCSSGAEDGGDNEVEKEDECGLENLKDVVTDLIIDVGQTEAVEKTDNQTDREVISECVPLPEAASMIVAEVDNASVIEPVVSMVDPKIDVVSVIDPEVSVVNPKIDVVSVIDPEIDAVPRTVEVFDSPSSTVPEEQKVPVVDSETKTVHTAAPDTEELKAAVTKPEDLQASATEPIAQIADTAEPMSVTTNEANVVDEELPEATASETEEGTGEVPPEVIPLNSNGLDEVPAVPVPKRAKPIGRRGGRKGKNQNHNHRREKQKSTRVLKPYVDDGILKFRATCVRSGPNHNFTSMEAAWDFGGTLNDTFFWTVDLTRYDLNAVLNVEQDVVYVTAALTEESLHRRNITHFGPTTLRATICYHLIHMAEPVAGEIIIDPMCGGGSIPIEGALAFPATFHMSGDHHDKAMIRLEGNLANFSRQNVNLKVDGLCWDAARLPLKDSSVDVVVTDLPYGIRIGQRKDSKAFYSRALKELARVVRGGRGRAVLMTADEGALNTALRSNQESWKLIRSTRVSHGGLRAVAFLLLRKKL